MDLTISILISFLAVRGFRFELTGDGLVQVNTLSFIWLLTFLFFVWILCRSRKETDRRLKAYAGLLSFILACFYAAGLGFEKMKSLSWIWNSRGNLINYMNLFFSNWVLYYCCTFSAFQMLRDRSRHKAEKGRAGFSFRKTFVFWGLLLIFYIPWYLYCYPGVLTVDSASQIKDALSVETLSNHHSAFLDLIIRGILLPVKHLTGSVQIGIGICTLVQMLIMTFVFALTIERIFRYTKNRILRAGVFLWFAAYPVSNIYAFTMWKDIPFAICVLALMLCLDAAAEDEYGYFHSVRNCILLALALLLLPLLRHNGILVSAVMTVYLIFRFKSFRKRVMLLCGSWIILFAVWTYLVLPALQVKPGSVSEAMSVPLQQIARALSNHHGDLHPNLVLEAESYFTEPEIWLRYEPIIADPVKYRFKTSMFEDDPGQFFRLWKNIGERCPVDYVEAFLHNNYGYWFPETTYWISSIGVLTAGRIEDIHTAPITKLGIVDMIYNWYAYHQEEKTPLLPLLYSRGACFWVWLFFGVWCLYRNRKKFVLLMPGFLVWAGILISPVYNEYRYVYSLFIGLPLIMVSALRSQSTDPSHPADSSYTP